MPETHIKSDPILRNPTIYKNKKHYYQPINHPQRNIHSTHIRKSRETKPTFKKNPASAVEPNSPTYLVLLHRKLIGGPPFRAPLTDLASLDGVNALATTLTATSAPTATVSLVWRVLTGERGKEGKKRKKKILRE